MDFWHKTLMFLLGALSGIICFQLGRFRGQEEEKTNETVRRINSALERRKMLIEEKQKILGDIQQSLDKKPKDNA